MNYVAFYKHHIKCVFRSVIFLKAYYQSMILAIQFKVGEHHQINLTLDKIIRGIQLFQIYREYIILIDYLLAMKVKTCFQFLIRLIL